MIALKDLRELIKETEVLLRTKQTTIKVLQETFTELEKHITKCKIASTVGNAATIASTAMLFTPIAPIGVGVLILGGGTTTGTLITQSRIEASYKRHCQEQLDKDNECTLRYF